jgi:hypothetical protein
MNFLCHAIPYFDNPLMAVSTGVPDWLSVVDRRIRARGKLASQFVDSDDHEIQMVARGVLRHVADDRWFHGTAAFVELNMRLAVELRDLLPGDEGFRPTFVGHILIEMLLDSLWIRDDPQIAERYYDCFFSGASDVIQRCVNLITGKPTAELTVVIDRFVESRFLYDYLDDDRMRMRLNQVMNRVGLPPLPAEVEGWLPRARKLVESRRRHLLTPPDASDPFSPFTL